MGITPKLSKIEFLIFSTSMVPVFEQRQYTHVGNLCLLGGVFLLARPAFPASLPTRYMYIPVLNFPLFLHTLVTMAIPYTDFHNVPLIPPSLLGMYHHDVSLDCSYVYV